MQQHSEYDVYISYSSKDKEAVKPLAERLRDDGLRVWFDVWAIRPGDSIPGVIGNGLQNARVVLLFMSRNAFQSDWVKREYEVATLRDPANLAHHLIPVLLEDCQVPDILRVLRYVDWRGQSDDEYHLLLQECRSAAVLPEPRVGGSAIILGPGFSQIAGVPSGTEVFAAAPWFASATAHRHDLEVIAEWDRWLTRNPGSSTEQWMCELWQERDRASARSLYAKSMRFVLARAVTPDPWGANGIYFQGITSSVKNAAHQSFWQELLRKEYAVGHVVSVNHDILAEQGMHKSHSPHRDAPICYYGGFQYYQIVRKMRNVSGARSKYDAVELGHEVVLYKLRGSLNWALEPHGFKIHDDVRAAFRTDPQVGVPAVVPPVAGLALPEWLRPVREAAEKALAQSRNWIVCGLLPSALEPELRGLFSRASSCMSDALTIWVIGGEGDDLGGEWNTLCHDGATVRCLPMPDGITDPRCDFTAGNP